MDTSFCYQSPWQVGNEEQRLPFSVTSPLTGVQVGQVTSILSVAVLSMFQMAIEISTLNAHNFTNRITVFLINTFLFPVCVAGFHFCVHLPCPFTFYMLWTLRQWDLSSPPVPSCECCYRSVQSFSLPCSICSATYLINRLVF